MSKKEPLEVIEQIELSKLHPFPDHPFGVRDDDSMQQTVTAKKEAYAELKKVRDELRDLTVHKANYEELRDLEEREKRKEKEHGRE